MKELVFFFILLIVNFALVWQSIRNDHLKREIATLKEDIKFYKGKCAEEWDKTFLAEKEAEIYKKATEQLFGNTNKDLVKMFISTSLFALYHKSQ